MASTLSRVYRVKTPPGQDAPSQTPSSTSPDDTQDDDDVSYETGYVHPISNLPAEILLFIFAAATQVDPPYPPRRTGDVTKPGSIGWIRITHVCTEWRVLCLATQSLWAYGIGRLPSVVQRCLERAGDTIPLHVSAAGEDLYDTEEHAQLDLLDVLPLERVRSLDVIFSRGDPPLALMLDGRDYPSLESLDLFGALADHSDTPSIIIAPTLLTARMKYIFQGLIAPSLTSLTVNVILGSSFNCFIETLKNSPSLRYLEFSQMVETSPFPSVSEGVYLPNLETLELEEWGFQSLSFLVDVISGPASAHVSASVLPLSAEISAGPFPHQTLSSIARSAWREGPPLGLKVAYTANELTLSFFSDIPIPPPDHIHPFPPSLKPKTVFSSPPYALAPGLRRLASQFNLSSISVLSLCGSDASGIVRADVRGQVDWARIFSVFPGVRTLHLCDTTGKPDATILAALGTHVDQDMVLLPRLDLLWLATNAVEREHAAYEVPLESLVGMLTSRAMQRPLEMRSPRGLRVDAKIALTNPNSEIPALLDLHVLVPNIRWKY